jgi:hypothetical protein
MRCSLGTVVAGWPLSGLPRTLSPAEVRRLSRSCDRRTPAGQGDYTVLVFSRDSAARRRELAWASCETASVDPARAQRRPSGVWIVRSSRAQKAILHRPREERFEVAVLEQAIVFTLWRPLD